MFSEDKYNRLNFDISNVAIPVLQVLTLGKVSVFPHVEPNIGDRDHGPVEWRELLVWQCPGLLEDSPLSFQIRIEAAIRMPIDATQKHDQRP
jgi:hypothetical protein